MIDSFSEYINNFIINFPCDILPGEHHFVAVYLVPKIYKITKIIPDYINPDGTKMLSGDIIFKKKNISIEVKYNKIVFTKLQYNNWIITQDEKSHNYFVGIDKNGIIIQSWFDFVKNYKNIFENIKGVKIESLTIKKYSPVIKINKYLKYCKQYLNNDEYFINDKENECLLEKKILKIFE